MICQLYRDLPIYFWSSQTTLYIQHSVNWTWPKTQRVAARHKASLAGRLALLEETRAKCSVNIKTCRMARGCLCTSKSYQLINSPSPSLRFLVQNLMVYFLHKEERHFVHNKPLLIKGAGLKVCFCQNADRWDQPKLLFHITSPHICPASASSQRVC